MSGRIELGQHQLERLGELISRPIDGDYPKDLIAFLNSLVSHGSSLLLVYHRDSRPKLFFDGLTNPQRRNSALSYVEAAYVLDPFYREALRQSEPQLLRFRDIGNPDAALENYLKTYYRNSAVIDEVNFIVPLNPGSAAALSIERVAGEYPFSDTEITRLQMLVPLVTSLILRLLADGSSGHSIADQAHAKLERRLSQFRSDVLTGREREVIRALLQGQSVAQIATRLGISVETARVHRRNIYGKLSISSQAELFAQAFDWVTGES